MWFNTTLLQLGTIHILFRHNFGLFLTHPLCQHKYGTEQACRPWVCRVCMAHPDFGRSVNPISTRGDRLCPPNYYWHTGIFRPSDGPVHYKFRLSRHFFHGWIVSGIRQKLSKHFTKTGCNALVLKNIQSQNSKITFVQNLTCIFLFVRPNLRETFQCLTPCKYVRTLMIWDGIDNLWCHFCRLYKKRCIINFHGWIVSGIKSKQPVYLFFSCFLK